MDRDLLKQQDHKKSMNEAYITKAEILGAGMLDNRINKKPSLLRRILNKIGG